MKYEITKEFSFDAAHQLEGKEIYGKCSNVHGHTYKLFITVGSEFLINGMVINFVELKSLVSDILEDLDHHFLNDVNWLTRPTTCENMVKDIYEEMGRVLGSKNAKIVEVRLYETPTSCAVYRGTSIKLQ